MGWFSKKKTYVGASTTRLIEQEPDVNRDTVLLAVRNSENISEQILDAHVNSLGTKSKAFFRYAANKYTEGLPSGTTSNYGSHIPNTTLVLKQLLGEPIEVQSVVFDFPDPELLAEEYLQNQRGWDRDTEIIGVIPSEISAVGNVLFDTASFVQDFTKIDITYKYTDSNTGTETTYIEEIDPPVTIKNTEEMYRVTYQLKDTALQPTGELLYWYYYPSSNTYPLLSEDGTFTEQSAYFPIIPLREDNVDLTTDSRKDTELFRTSKTLLNKLDTSYQEVGAAIHQNPDIDDVDHAYIVMSVPINTDRPDSIKYMFAYFQHLQTTSISTKQDYDYWEANHDNYAPPSNVVSIRDRRLRLDFMYRYIESSSVEGVLTSSGIPLKIGEAEKEIIIRPKTSAGGFRRIAFENSSLILRKQVTETHYEQLEIVGLHHINYVYGNYTVETTLEDTLGDDFNNFIIPVHFHVLQSMKLTERSSVIFDAYRLVFNSVQTVKLKWYQTGFFKAILIVIAVVVAIYTGYDLYTTVISAASVGAAITAVLVKIAINYAIGVALSFVAEKIGGVAAILIILIAYAYNQRGSGEASVEGLPFAQDLVAAARLSFTTYSSVIDTKLKEVYAETQELVQRQADLLEDLEEKEKELAFGIENPMLMLIQPIDTIAPEESPDQYYDRLIHAGNVGVLALDAIATYVDSKLALPKLPQSILNLNRHI